MIYLCKKIAITTIIAGSFCLNISQAQVTDVIYPSPQSANDSRFNDLIDLLDKALQITTDKYGSYTLNPSANIMGEGRYLEQIKSGKEVNIVYASTSSERENDLLPIRIPLRKGLLGYRLFLIDKNKQSDFSQVSNLYTLKSFTLGQGHDWGDLQVYRPQSFSIETASQYENLFKMLLKGRFDYFPRGVNEAWVEYDERIDQMPNLSVEKDLMLFYPWPYYFFVNKSDAELAKRVEEGLETMIDNGMFDEIFLKYHGQTIHSADMSNRRLFKVENPILPVNTPSLDDERLWYNPNVQ